ncbi:head-tail connector protein [Bremerella cremea]|uniref:head-tail connector protein n=1 Tax=Bremerella cremea TaxID=1031537 RepID=UPI0031E68B45
MQSYLVTPASTKLFSFDELRDHLRFVEVDDQADADRKAAAAVQFCERYCRRNFLTTVRRLTLRGFPACDEIQLDYPPWQSVASITYLDPAGSLQTLAPEVYGFDSDRGIVFLNSGRLWPCTLHQVNAVTISFTTGWTSPDLVPADIKQACLFLFGHNYANREAVINGSISAEVKMTVEAYLAPWVEPRY